MSKSFQGPAGVVSRRDAPNDDLPPAYSGPTSPLVDDTLPTSSSSAGQQLGILGLPNLAFANYAPPTSALSRDSVTVTVTDAALLSSARAFASFVREQVALPPKIEVSIVGTHKSMSQGVDFNISLSVLPYFVPRGGRPGLNYIRIPTDGGGGPSVGKPATGTRDIDDCARAFVADKTWPKSFTVTRKVVNYDTDYLQGAIHGLANSLNYKGTLKVMFVHTHGRTVFRAPRPANLSFAASFKSAFAATKDVAVEAVWPYADRPVHEDDETAAAAGQRRICVVRSERGWWQDWKGVVRDAMLTKKTGRLGMDDYIDFASDPAARDRKAPNNWGADEY